MTLPKSSVTRTIDTTGNKISTFLRGDYHVQGVALVDEKGNHLHGYALDAFSRMRTASPYGTFDNKNISSRNPNQWVDHVEGMVITYTGLTGTFTVGEEIRGTLPATRIPLGIVDTDDGATMTVTADDVDFTVGDTITGQTSGATATIATVNSGSYVEHDYDTSSVTLSVGTGSGDRAVRQSYRYHAYVPGKSQLINMTFTLGTAKANVVRRSGYFDDLDGLFLEQNGTTDVALVVRSSTSGSPVDTRIPQSTWNVDTMDGTGQSGINLGFDKIQILVIDFQWLGAGRVRFGFDIDGIVYYAHEVLNANNITSPYMKTPSLPTRYEIVNSAATASQSTMKETCCAVVSEGGYQLPGFEFSADRGITTRAVTTAGAPILAIRLKNEYPTGQPNRKTVKFLNVGFLVKTNDAHIEVLHVHDPIDVTATWVDVSDGSSVEYSTDITAYTGRPTHKIEADYVASGIGSSAAASVVSGEFTNLHGFLSQNFDSTASEMFVIEAKATSGTSNILAHITWIEFQ